MQCNLFRWEKRRLTSNPVYSASEATSTSALF